MNGDVILSFASLYVPALLVGLLLRLVRPAWGWTPLWIAVIVTVALSFLRII
ncbi:hypothetical protein [Sediminicoccus sp. KRV36]|uniref:hypothetical protein n=1 Tax=Sediminicoccus sp. KRV36 TaxID=3133721 RepID=UPI00200CC14E|nr:hypothetical protein [Sediminicoccus rosea]UPY38387.1 hypothetical protein LHU95_06755 [Sediminicoccus rosea]